MPAATNGPRSKKRERERDRERKRNQKANPPLKENSDV
jgi:hypothetical protein